MRKTKIIFLTFLFFIGCNLKNDNTSENLGYRNELIKKINFIKANTDTIQEEDTVKTVFEGNQYTLYPNGKIEIQKSDSIIDSIRLNTKDIIEEAYFYTYKDNFIVFYTETDFDAAASFVECFEKNTYNVKWRNEIGGFNLSSPFILDSLCYLSSIGFVGKLNLNNGKYFWKHTDLYEKTKFNAFSRVEFENCFVHFIESKRLVDKEEAGRIVIDDETGEIKEIIKNVR